MNYCRKHSRSIYDTIIMFLKAINAGLQESNNYESIGPGEGSFSDGYH